MMSAGSTGESLGMIQISVAAIQTVSKSVTTRFKRYERGMRPMQFSLGQARSCSRPLRPSQPGSSRVHDGLSRRRSADAVIPASQNHALVRVQVSVHDPILDPAYIWQSTVLRTLPGAVGHRTVQREGSERTRRRPASASITAAPVIGKRSSIDRPSGTPVCAFDRGQGLWLPG